MDRTFNDAINLTIIILGGYLCFFGLHERRTGALGVCLVLFGGCFALANHLRPQSAPSLTPRRSCDD